MAKSTTRKSGEKAADKKAKPAKGKDTKPAKGKDTKPAKGKDTKPAKGKDAKPAETEDRVAATTGATTSRDDAPREKATLPDPGEIAALLRVGPGFDLSAVDPGSTPGVGPDGRERAEDALAEGAERLSELQERLFAAAHGGDPRNVLLLVQGMDTAGKGGIVRHVVGAVDPQGVRHVAFKAPTAEERAHDFLWRIRKALPLAGEIGVFDRSHYEDVLVVRVHDLVPRAVWGRRYATINRFEAGLAAKGTTLVKVMLHISADEQKQRLAERLDRPDKHWKYNPHDLDERTRWADYQEAYQVALTKCSPEATPWFVVPADHKWYARWAVSQLLLGALQGIDPQWPAADFDVEAERARLAGL